MRGVVCPRLRTNTCAGLQPLSGLVLLLFLLVWYVPPLHAQRNPLPAQEQMLVNNAIQRGVAFLKQTQVRTGAWPRRDKNHAVGYTALPGLTLLECGVPDTDPAVVKAARAVRRSAPYLTETYEIALSLLFLDRLDEPGDRKLIQTLAIRLIAGQSITGGWGYRCPKVSARDQHTILVALQKLDPLPELVAKRRVDDPRLQPGIAGKQPPLRGKVAGKGPHLEGEVAGPGRGGLEGGAAGGSPGLQGTPASGKEQPNSPGSSHTFPFPPAKPHEGEGSPGQDPAPDKPKPAPQRLAFRQGRGCIKMTDWVPDEEADEEARQARENRPVPRPRIEDVVPARLRPLPIFREGQGLLVDPPKRRKETWAPTTDNSNTQFAILALWAARRHDVPMARSLRLLIRRFKTSQNADGTWSYRYQFGGGQAGKAAMTAVGLLGLAVGYDLTDPHGQAKALDPTIVKGFTALSQHVGAPVARPNIPQQANLYLLWSIERVAVLYNMATIGGKDWYRWAAQMLVAHQGPLGNWQNGGYPHAHPIIDTCLALLVLKRVNLVRGLEARLPVNPVQLEKLLAKTTNPGESPASRPEPAPPVEEPTPPAKELPPRVEVEPPPLPAPAAKPVVSPVSRETAASEPVAEESSNRWLIWLILLVAVMALGGGITCLVLYRQEHEEEEEEEDEPIRRPRRRRRS
jgi:hypothetical protein